MQTISEPPAGFGVKTSQYVKMAASGIAFKLKPAGGLMPILETPPMRPSLCIIDGRKQPYHEVRIIIRKTTRAPIHF